VRDRCEARGQGMRLGYFVLARDVYSARFFGEAWVRYDDPSVKAFKLNAERQNGRAAMLGITGCLFHEMMGVDALYPTGGLGGAAPPTIF